jgi:hypothetical protein
MTINTNSIARKVIMRKVRRLYRLLKLNAPAIIICNDVASIKKSLPLYGEGYRYAAKHKADEEIAAAKNDIGICCVPECAKKISRKSEGDRGHMRCRRCRDRLADEMKKLDEMASKMFSNGQEA